MFPYPNLVLRDMEIRECTECADSSVRVPQLSPLCKILRDTEQEAGGNSQFYMLMQFCDIPGAARWLVLKKDLTYRTPVEDNSDADAEAKTQPDKDAQSDESPQQAKCAHKNAIPSVRKGKHTWCIDCGASSTMTWDKGFDADPLMDAFKDPLHPCPLCRDAKRHDFISHEAGCVYELFDTLRIKVDFIESLVSHAFHEVALLQKDKAEQERINAAL
ncbi:MAG: hypothetical protein EOO40_00500 [Deltaproteobacteria bacterium]|nr:MAG: hypothetical protein EOO40_00500 [Deltaproteobacteria bacterium]